ncbi:MAG: peptidase MA family metallohydrolase [Bradymonadia bacterium]
MWAALLICPSLALGEVPLERAEVRGFVFEWSEGQGGLAAQLKDAAPEHADRIYEALGGVPKIEKPIRVTLLSDEAEMLATARERHGRTPPEWAAGLAYPRLKQIYLHGATPAGEVDKTFQHEIAHVALGEMLDKVNPPLWFHEGIAIHLSEGMGLDRARKLTEAALAGGLLKLEEIEARFPKGPARAETAYAQAIHFLGHLRKTYGEDRLKALIGHMSSEQVGFHEAFEATYPLSLKEVERRWRESVEVWWGWLPLIFGSALLWGGATFLFVWAWRRRRRAQKVRLEELRGEDAVDMAEDIEIAHGLQRPPDLRDPYEGRPPTIH